MQTNATYVLIPGAWHGGWAFGPVARRLRGAGHAAVALTMPGLTDGDDPRGVRLGDAVAHVVAEVERRDLREVVLVAHSWGAFPMVGAAHRLADRMAKLVFVGTPVPTRGISQNDMMSPEIAGFVRSMIDASPERTILLPFESFQESLMQDEPERAQRIVFDQLLPQPGGYMLDESQAPEVSALGLPVAYLLGQQDQGLPRPGAEFAAELGVEPTLVPGTHENLLTHPDQVTKALLAA